MVTMWYLHPLPLLQNFIHKNLKRSKVYEKRNHKIIALKVDDTLVVTKQESQTSNYTCLFALSYLLPLHPSDQTQLKWGDKLCEGQSTLVKLENTQRSLNVNVTRNQERIYVQHINSLNVACFTNLNSSPIKDELTRCFPTRTQCPSAEEVPYRTNMPGTKLMRIRLGDKHFVQRIFWECQYSETSPQRTLLALRCVLQRGICYKGVHTL